MSAPACLCGHPEANHQAGRNGDARIRLGCGCCSCPGYTPRPTAIRAALWRALTANNPAYPAVEARR